MKKLVQDRFNNIEIAITNEKMDIILNDRQSGIRKRQKHTRSKKGEKLEKSEKSNDERLEELKEVEELEEYTGISGINRRRNSKELDLKEILDNGKGNDEDDNDDTDIEVCNTKKPFSRQQIVIKTVTTTISL